MAESKRASLAALDAPAGLEPGREAALAYIGLVAVADDGDAAIEWAIRAGELGEQIGQPDRAPRSPRGRVAPAFRDGGQSGREVEAVLEQALADGYEFEACSCWIRLADVAVGSATTRRSIGIPR
jgi:hypothetical protein